VAHLGQRQGAILGAEQRQRHQRGLGDRGRPVDPVADLERDPLDGVLMPVRVRQRLAERERLAEPDPDLAEAAALGARVTDQPAEALGRLLRPVLLGRHRADFV
jgi:hypothetical protein